MHNMNLVVRSTIDETHIIIFIIVFSGTPARVFSQTLQHGNSMHGRRQAEKSENESTFSGHEIKKSRGHRPTEVATLQAADELPN